MVLFVGDASHAYTRLGETFFYVLTGVMIAVGGRLTYVIFRRSLRDETAEALSWLMDLLTAVYCFTLYFLNRDALSAALGIFQLVIFFDPGNRRRRRKALKIIGEKSRAILARLRVTTPPNAAPEQSFTANVRCVAWTV
ncbi:hypothetical protein [Jatrophihabitans sp.]|uniref:hypothetical protein n=1 Tax=Jatrophihabitans sp. TaxID=1932789 RepID=UPI0030C6DD35